MLDPGYGGGRYYSTHSNRCSPNRRRIARQASAFRTSTCTSSSIMSHNRSTCTYSPSPCPSALPSASRFGELCGNPSRSGAASPARSSSAPVVPDSGRLQDRLLAPAVARAWRPCSCHRRTTISQTNTSAARADARPGTGSFAAVAPQSFRFSLCFPLPAARKLHSEQVVRDCSRLNPQSASAPAPASPSRDPSVLYTIIAHTAQVAKRLRAPHRSRTCFRPKDHQENIV